MIPQLGEAWVQLLGLSLGQTILNLHHGQELA